MRCYVVREEDGAFSRGVEDFEPIARESADLLVRVEYSGVNYKDALVASPSSRVRRVPVLVGGVDAAGVVVTSTDPGIAEGTPVCVHGGDLGVARDGGFAPLVYAPSRLVSVLPAGISTRDAMVIGTAGFTAMASVLALEEHGLEPGAEVLVTGATGGVGSLAVSFLHARDYQPVASTGSPQGSAWLYERGATRVIGRDDIADRPDRVLASERWAGAIDCVGGETLHHILRSLRYGAGVAASGLVASPDLNTNVYPFITRAVALLGIDAVEASARTRAEVWRQLGAVATRVDFAGLIDSTITLEGLDEALETIRSGKTRGRIVVDPTEA
ncbi:MAG: acryloyl-CoA reductase [Acidimicrobiales bacterium]|jgi:acrylyl-CoA reductase (NADPH)